MSCDCHIYIRSPSLTAVTKCCVNSCLRRFDTLEGGKASHGNILGISCGIKRESTSAQRYKVRKYFRSDSFTLLLVPSLSVAVHLDLTWKGRVTY